MKAYVLKLELLSNLHVGDEGGMGLVDNSVQRDSVLEDMPIIPGSGVKGALREYFRRKGLAEENDIFGYPPPKDGKGEKKSGDGKYKFFDAFCLARPLRVSSEGDTPYVLATSTAIIDHTVKLLQGIGFDLSCDKNGRSFAELIGDIESLAHSFRDKTQFLVPTDKTSIKTIEGETVASMPDNTGGQYVRQLLDKLIGNSDWAIAKNLNDYDLPVRARNSLEGTGNLWFEEYVPHKSIFLAPLLTPDGDDGALLDLKDKDPVQFGAGASVGMGYAKVSVHDRLPLASTTEGQK